VGNDPSISDVIKMVHPKGKTPEQQALFGYLIDRDVDVDKLPKVVRQYEAFKGGDSTEVPGVEFRLLDSLGLSTNQWADVAKSMRFHALRMNLNTLLRHGVLKDKAMVKYVADKLRDEEAIRKARVMPYQLMTAYLTVAPDNGLPNRGWYSHDSGPTQPDMPVEITLALQDALEIACENVPKFDGHVVLAPDVSGSMHSPITGAQGRRPASRTLCVHVAALVCAAVARVNPGAEILPFADKLYRANLNPRDSIMTNAAKLASFPAGGTNCSLPLADLNRRKAKADVVWYVSDYESWIDRGYGHRTGLATEWEKFSRRNKGATLLLNDLTPHSNAQAKESGNTYQIGGFSDAVFKFSKIIAESKNNSAHWVDIVEGISLESN
jgi:60 kDa SS-A/Ro ribonucleoprotein